VNEIVFLLDKARESLDVAEMLERHNHPDFAASRAYFTMFYIVQALLLHKGLSFSSHSAVIAAFGKEYTKTGLFDQKYHRYLLDSLDARNLGDYGIGENVSPAEATKLINRAKEFLSVAQNFLKLTGK